MWMLAEPNGAGKSTTGRELLAGFEIDEVLNPDEFASRLAQDRLPHVRWRAGVQKIERERELIQEGRPFARETTLAGRTILAAVGRAKKSGYRIGLIYVGLKNVNLAISRVRARAAKGGHDVPEDFIRRRYSRSLENLPEVAMLVDQAHILDNSSSRSPAVRLMEIRAGKIVYQRESLPRWFQQVAWPRAARRTPKRR
jgi:predicted ABC-type ATPase